MNDKKTIRKRNLNLRNQISLTKKIQDDKKIIKIILASKDFKDAKVVALFYPINSEVDVRTLIIKAIALKKIVVLPRMTDDQHLTFHKITSLTDLIIDNPWMIKQPKKECEMIFVSQIDIIYLPLLAYDMYGNRIGYGKGYYDRTLKGVNNLIIVGIGYEWQQISDSINSNTKDIPLNKVITQLTEKNIG